MCNKCNHSTDNAQEGYEYTTCKCCGQLVQWDDTVFVRDRGDGFYVCRDCINTGYAQHHMDVCQCDDCGEYVIGDLTYSDDWGSVVCDWCYGANYYTCVECGRIIHSVDTYYDDETGDNLCESCYEERMANRCDYVHSYHDGPSSGLNFLDMPDDMNRPARYFGIELEVDDESDDDAIREAYAALNNSTDVDADYYAHFEHDGSLDTGFEIITQPMTRKYLDYFKPRFTKACKILQKAGYRSHDANMCGLHIHVSRNSLSEETIDRMVAAISLYWHTCVIVSRRTPTQLRNYATSYAYMGEYPDDTPEEVILRAKRYKNFSSSRYFALNTTNDATIELRICRGTLNIETIYASVDFYCALIQFAETYSETDMLHISPDDFITYLKGYSEQLKKYMESRGL